MSLYPFQSPDAVDRNKVLGYASDPTPTGPRVVDLGNGYSLVYPNPDNPQLYQIVANKDLSGSSGGGVSATSAFSEQQANARQQAALAEQARQFNEQFGMDKAKFNISTNENARQFDTNTALAYYKQLIDTASNPRNYVANFFLHRGQQPPPGVAGYGTQLNQNDIVPFDQFLQRYLAGARGGASAAGAPAGAAPSAAAPVPAGAVQLAAGNYRMPGQTGQVAPVGVGAPTSPTNLGMPADAQVGFVPGGGGSTYQTPISLSDFATQTLKPYAKGGVIPEPVVGVGLKSGQKYTFGEKGPEAVVPNDMFSKMMQMARGSMHYSEDDGKKKRSMKIDNMTYGNDRGDGTNSYASGGTIGYDNPFGADTLGAMQQSNAVPPFLQRLMQQAQGNQAYGTNVPQANALPAGVPLVSGLAYNQMAPSEQQALQSYVSSYGVDPTDYLNQIASQVQGRPASPRTAYQAQ